jgi:hypothetical protein
VQYYHGHLVELMGEFTTTPRFHECLTIETLDTVEMPVSGFCYALVGRYRNTLREGMFAAYARTFLPTPETGLLPRDLDIRAVVVLFNCLGMASMLRQRNVVLEVLYITAGNLIAAWGRDAELLEEAERKKEGETGKK